MLFIPLLAAVEQDVNECFHNGGGVPYSAYPCFQRIMTGQLRDTRCFAYRHELPPVSGFVACLQTGIDVADVGCGCGRAINLMAQVFPNGRSIGFVFFEDRVPNVLDPRIGLGMSRQFTQDSNTADCWQHTTRRAFEAN